MFLGVLFSIGAVIDEAQGQHDKNNYISARKCSRARSFLVLKWTILGFFLTISYKSVFRAILMKIEYDDTIDTIDDMVQSNRQFMVAGDSNLRWMLETDTRKTVKVLAEKVTYYNHGKKRPADIEKGYIILKPR